MELSEEVENLCLADMHIEKQRMYAASFEQNMLIEYHMENHKVNLLGWFCGYEFSDSFYNNSIFKYRDSLFFFSMNSYEVAEFDLKSQQFRYYSPSNKEHEKNLVCSVCRVENEIWMFRKGGKTDSMVFSMEKKFFSQHKWKIKGNINQNMELPFESSVYIDSSIWRCIPGSSDLLVIDTKHSEAHVLNLDLGIPLLTMNYEDGYLYILSVDGQYLIELSVSSLAVAVYQTGYDGNSEYPFIDTIKIGDYFLFLPCYEQELFYYKLQGRKLCFVKKIKFPEPFKKIHDTEHRTMFMRWKKRNNTAYLFPFAGNGMIRIQLDTLSIQYLPVKLSKQDYLAWRLWMNPKQYEEKMELSEYLTAIRNELNEKGMNDGKEVKHYENKIWEMLRADCIK